MQAVNFCRQDRPSLPRMALRKESRLYRKPLHGTSTNFTLDLFQLWPMAASTLIAENDIIQMACASDTYTCQVKLQFLNDIMWEIGVEAAAMGNG